MASSAFCPYCERRWPYSARYRRCPHCREQTKFSTRPPDADEVTSEKIRKEAEFGWWLWENDRL